MTLRKRDPHQHSGSPIASGSIAEYWLTKLPWRNPYSILKPSIGKSLRVTPLSYMADLLADKGPSWVAIRTIENRAVAALTTTISLRVIVAATKIMDTLRASQVQPPQQV
jgi:hypothetical protein